MGMFDYIRVPTKFLPVSDEEKILFEDEDFQTKDFDRLLSLFEVHPDGSLIEVARGGPNWDYSEKFIPKIIDGQIRFYTIVERKFREFNGVFVRGRLTEVTEIEQPQPPEQ